MTWAWALVKWTPLLGALGWLWSQSPPVPAAPPELGWINAFSNITAMGLLAYLIVYGIPKAIAAIAVMQKDALERLDKARADDRDGFKERNADLKESLTGAEKEQTDAIRELKVEVGKQTDSICTKLERLHDQQEGVCKVGRAVP